MTVLICAVAVMAAACSPATSSRPAAPTRLTVHGTVSLVGSENFATFGANHCYGSDGYDDLIAGAQVVISNDTGHTLGITELSQSSVTMQGEDCVLRFSTRVSAQPAFYGITVTHRGTIKFSRAEVRTAALTIGD